MRIALLVLSILAMIVNLLATLISVTMLMAGSPNFSPGQLLFLHRMMLAFGVVGLVCLIGAIRLRGEGGRRRRCHSGRRSAELGTFLRRPGNQRRQSRGNVARPRCVSENALMYRFVRPCYPGDDT